MTYTITPNAEYGSLEVRFSSMPTPAVRSALKNLRFRWHGVNRYWYGKADENALRETLDRLIDRASRIASANRSRGSSAAPNSRISREAGTFSKPAPAPEAAPASITEEVMQAIEPALAELENAVRSETERTIAEYRETPAAEETPAFPKREDLKALSFTYRIGNSAGQACFTPELIENAPASTLKVIYPMIDGIENADERKRAWFFLTALAWYKAAENPEKRSAYRTAADLYRQKTGEAFPAPETEGETKPASPKTVTAACKRIAKNAPTGWEGLIDGGDGIYVSDTCRIVCLKTCSPDLAAVKTDAAERLRGFIASAESENHGRSLPLPTVRELKAWIKCQPKRKYLTYEIDGILVNAHYLLDMLEALPGCSACISETPKLSSPILFTSGEDRGILMQCRPDTATAAA